MFAKRFHTRGVAQVQPENFQPAAPFLKVRLGGVTDRRVAWKTCADDELCACAQKFDARLITNFYTSAGEKRHAAAQIRRLGALEKIQFRALRAKLIVEMVNRGIILLADVAILRLD